VEYHASWQFGGECDEYITIPIREVEDWNPEEFRKTILNLCIGQLKANWEEKQKIADVAKKLWQRLLDKKTSKLN
jgi:hypothetical protein